MAVSVYDKSDAVIYDSNHRRIEKYSRVKVIGQGRYDKHLIGKTGSVRSAYGDDVGVVLDEIKNITTPYGYFYFKCTDLEVITNDMTDLKGEKDEGTCSC